MALSDLEKKLLEPESAKPAPKKVEKKVEKKAAPAPAPAPVKATSGKASYDLGGIETKPKPEKKAPPPKVEKPAPKPKPVPVAKAPPAAKPAPVVKEPVAKDPNALPAGVALGAAPLLLAPVALLSAGRGALQGTKDRREKIQQEIAAFEAAKAKKAVSSEVDGGGLVTALVSRKEKGISAIQICVFPSYIFVVPMSVVGILGSFCCFVGSDCYFAFLAIVGSCCRQQASHQSTKKSSRKARLRIEGTFGSCQG